MTSGRTDRVVVLTGANGGIGSHMLTALLDAGYRVAALDVDGDSIRPLQDRSPDRCQFVKCDVTQSDAVDAAISHVIEEWERIDILVNNAAVATVASFDEQSIAETEREFAVNLFGYSRLIRAVLPHMRERDAGIIHNMGSGTGDVGHPGLTGYAATKGAIKALTRSLRLELRGTGISCTLMVPPTTNTQLSADLGYPSWLVEEPDAVGRKLAAKIESTAPRITPDWKTTLGLGLIQYVPGLWPNLIDRYVDQGL